MRLQCLQRSLSVDTHTRRNVHAVLQSRIEACLACKLRGICERLPSWNMRTRARLHEMHVAVVRALVNSEVEQLRRGAREGADGVEPPQRFGKSWIWVISVLGVQLAYMSM